MRCLIAPVVALGLLSLPAKAADSPIGSPSIKTTQVTPFTPTVTFSTPGDLAVSYATQTAYYYKVDKLVYVYITVAFTPTYTTASGTLRIGGLPVAASVNAFAGLAIQQYSPAAFPGATGTQVLGVVVAGQTYLQIWGEKSGIAPLTASTSQVINGTQQTITLSGVYLASS